MKTSVDSSTMLDMKQSKEDSEYYALPSYVGSLDEDLLPHWVLCR